MSNALQGDLGVSWFTGQPVTEALTSRLAVTLSLVIGATVLTAVVSVVLGILAATRRGWADRLVQVVAVLGFAIPGFLVALGLVLVFAINLGWFAPTGYTRSPSRRAVGCRRSRCPSSPWHSAASPASPPRSAAR